MTLLKSRTLSVSINSKPKTVYEFVLNLENFPKWAKMFCRSIKLLNGEWIAEILQEQAKVRITKINDFGILDHYVKLLSSPNVDEVFVPMRVCAEWRRKRGHIYDISVSRYVRGKVC